MIRSCFYQIRRLRCARRGLTVDTAKTLASSLILSRLDYCNSLLVGVTQRQCDRLQSILNTSAKVIHGGTRRDHVKPVLRDKLHWLRLRQRIAYNYKLCLLVYKSLHDSSPRYMKELVVPVARLPSLRRLRSASTLMLRKPLARKKVGERGFSVAAPAAWNELPLSVKNSQSLTVFKSQLKTHLFSLSYSL